MEKLRFREDSSMVFKYVRGYLDGFSSFILCVRERVIGRLT